MRALYYTEPYKFDVRQVPIPKCGDDDVLLKVSCCGVCGTDGHIHEGEFIAKFPLIPGHETVGVVVATGPVSFDLPKIKDTLDFREIETLTSVDWGRIESH